MKGKVILGAVVVAIAAAAGFRIQRMLADHPSVTDDPNRAATAAVGREAAAAAKNETSAVSVPDGTSANRDDDTPKQRPVPEMVPAITLPDRDGVAHPLAEWSGRPLIINFWATWCAPCREEIPLLKSLRKERLSDRLEVVGIAIDQRDAVVKYAHDIGIDYPVLIGEKEGYAAAESFGVSLVLPFSVFVDSRGHIVTLKIGELHADEAGFILDRIREVDARRLELAAARQQIADKLREFSVDRGKRAASSSESAPAAVHTG